MERAAGIEPASSAWKAEVLPLNYARRSAHSRYPIAASALKAKTPKRAQSAPQLATLTYALLKYTRSLRWHIKLPLPANHRTLNLVEGGGFEPPKLSRQIYSLIPLTARESLQTIPHWHKTITSQKRGAYSLRCTPCCQCFASKRTDFTSKMELARGVEPPTG